MLVFVEFLWVICIARHVRHFEILHVRCFRTAKCDRVEGILDFWSKFDVLPEWWSQFVFYISA